MTVAIALLTSDRREYTEVTLRTLAAHNDLSQFALLHADDASTDPAVPALARAYGFRTVVQSQARQGWLSMRQQLFYAARKYEWTIVLENDVEWARPFPWALFDFIRTRCPSVYCLRLHGAFKDRARADPSLAFHKSHREKPVRWKRIKYAPEPAEVGFIHWSGQPSVTRTGELRALHQQGIDSQALTARVVENVTYHIGTLRTVSEGSAHRAPAWSEGAAL